MFACIMLFMVEQPALCDIMTYDGVLFHVFHVVIDYSGGQ